MAETADALEPGPGFLPKQVKLKENGFYINDAGGLRHKQLAYGPWGPFG